MKNLAIILLVICFLKSCEGQAGRIKCTRADGSFQRCMPEFMNAAFNKSVYANNTCGMDQRSGKPKRERYCVQSGVLGVEKVCDICDAGIKGKAHPPHYMTDIKDDKNRTWWQSHTLLDNKFPVELVLDLGKTFDITYIRIRFHSPRPHSFAIYKKSSTDPNAKWEPFQYYSGMCTKVYKVPNNEIVRPSRQNIALCTEQFSEISPLSGGNIAFSTLQGRPLAYDFDNNRQLQDWVTVAAIKISLDRMNTFGDEVFGDPNVLRSYYFAISDLAVGGRCKCNGHAADCDLRKGKLVCKCDHFTTGDDCEKCAPLYNDKEWKRATARNPHPCVRCNCNDLADACVYDAQLDRATGRGGRCVNCRNNTDGPNCERCRTHYYRRITKEACKPCNCNPVGSRFLQCNSYGQCDCRPGVTGEKCDKCLPGYFGFSERGCRPCQCNTAGSLSGNCGATGQCECKENVVGKRCDQCKTGYFDLDSTSPKGCKPCFCYGHGITCESRPGIGASEIKTDFSIGLEDWKVEDINGKENSELATWQARSQVIRIQAQDTTPLYMVAPSKYLGNRLSSYGRKLKFIFGVTDANGLVASGRDIIFEGAGLKAEYSINAQGNSLPRPRFQTYTFYFREPKGMSAYDFQKLLSDLTAIKIRTTYIKGSFGVLNSVSMESTQPVSLNSPDQVGWLEKCQCEKGYTGLQCEKCDRGYTRLNKGPYGKCVLCNCNNHAKECDPETGVCNCQDFTTGKNCERCISGYYGNPTRGETDDCKKCPCIFGSQCIQIGSRVKCTDCPVGHIGDRCERCQDGYFGDPEGRFGPPTRCKKCDCNSNIDSNDIGNCNTTTGECLKCIYNTRNGPQLKCELCKDGYYGDALALPKGQCKPCNCYVNGTLWPPGFRPNVDLLPCDADGNCKCRNNVVGKNCSTCPNGYWNVASGNGCEACDCDPIGSVHGVCDVETGQCECKKGIAGRKCEGCAPGHYRFSKDGCKNCKCNEYGSLHVNCSDLGVCYCRPGVLGVKCDQCPENKYNLSVGCISCPPCYNLVQRKVHELREKLEKLQDAVGLAKLPRNVTFKDQNFVSALKTIQQETDRLLSKVLSLKREDLELDDYFRKLLDEFSRLKLSFRDLDVVVKTAVNRSDVARTEIKGAEDIIEEIKKLLEKARYQLDVYGGRTFKEALKLAKDISDRAKKMKKVAAEAKSLADRHTDEASRIKQTSEMAYNMSDSAYKTGKKARGMQEDMYNKLSAMAERAEAALKLANEASRTVEGAMNQTQATLKEANEVLNEANKPLPDVAIEKIRQKSADVYTNALKIVNQSKALLSENKELMVKYQANEKEARELMKNGYKEYDLANKTYARAKAAYDKAKKAKEDAERIVAQAVNTLKILKSFNEQIKLSKANFTKAKELIPVIEELIKGANVTAREGQDIVFMAKGSANESISLITKAEKNVSETKKVLEQMKQLAEERRNETEKLETDLSVNLNELKRVNNTLNDYKSQAERDSLSVKKALNKSKQAQEDARQAQNDLLNALDDVTKLLEDLSKLEKIDLAKLADAENKFERANSTIIGRLENEVKNLQRLTEEQSNKINEYNLQVGPLEKEIAHVFKIYKTFPQKCFLPEPPIEG